MLWLHVLGMEVANHEVALEEKKKKKKETEETNKSKDKQKKYVRKSKQYQ